MARKKPGIKHEFQKYTGNIIKTRDWDDNDSRHPVKDVQSF